MNFKYYARLKAYAICLLVFIGLTLPSYAISINVVQGRQSRVDDIGVGYFTTMNETFRRDIYSSAGARVFFANVFNQQVYSAEIGDKVTWRWFQIGDDESEQLLNEKTIEYIGNLGPQMFHCWRLPDGDNFCSESSASGLSQIQFFHSMRCAPENKHVIRVYFNEVEGGNHLFNPVKFPPLIQSIEHDDFLPVHVRVKDGGTDEPMTTDMVVSVIDGLGCGMPVNDASIEIETKIVKNSGGHTHDMQENNIGTGEFVLLDTDDVAPSYTRVKTGQNFRLPTAESGQFKDAFTKVTGKTGYVESNNMQGQFKTRYAAGLYGIKEEIKVIASRVIPIDGINYNIKAPDFPVSNLTTGIKFLMDLRLPTNNFIFNDGGGCPHFEDGQPNGGSGGSNSNAHFVTRSTAIYIDLAADKYFEITGDMLSLNDASLPLGGLMDHKVKDGEGKPTPYTGRLSRCHESHRTGNDIDINRSNLSGSKVDYTFREDDDTFVTRNVTRWSLLKELFNSWGLSKVDEKGSLHYRNDGKGQ